MEIFKPDLKNIDKGDCLPLDDDFFKLSHGLSFDPEFTLCSVACEEWGYIHILPRKRITCPKCLEVIKHCQEYKL